MANETEKNQQNPGQRQQNDAANVNDPNRKNPSQSGEQYQQDPTKKNPGQSGETTDRKDREGSDEVEKRRAS
jgi:hypothetical protein